MTAPTEVKGLYGGWRRSHTLGVGTLTGAQTLVLVLAVAVPLLVLQVGGGLGSLLITIPVSVVVMSLAVWQRQGQPLMSYLYAMARWQFAAAKGETSYRAQFLPAPECLDLPGMAAPTRLVRAEATGETGPVGLVWNQRTGTMTASLMLYPGGALLAHGSTVSGNVASWGEVLSRLSEEDVVRSASVTMQITPSSGQALTDHVRARMDRQAPTLAKETMKELVARSPRASASLACWMSLVMDPLKSSEKPANPAESAAVVLNALRGVDLTGAGADIVRAATDNDIKRMVRGAFDPADMDAPAEQMAELMWHEVGPVAGEDHKEAYEHDGSYSVSYVLREAPRKDVPYDVMLKLLSPGRFPRRVTLAYRVLSSDEGEAVVQRETNAADARAEYRRRTKRSTTRRERLDAERADRSAEEEAHGAAMVEWTVYVTTTVADLGDLPAARREVEMAARASGGLRFRPAYFGQSAAFLAGLPVGVSPLL